MDLSEPAEWTDYNDQGHLYVSCQYEPRAGYASLQDFFEARVRRSFQRGDGTYADHDINNYLERICIMKEISRQELMQFVSTYYMGVSSRKPSVPDTLRRAILCRDEPETKEVIWETANGYWAMSWSNG